MVTEAERTQLGPAERILSTILKYTDHMYHGRPGFVRDNVDTNAGLGGGVGGVSVAWTSATCRTEEGVTSVYTGTKKQPVRVGTKRENDEVVDEHGRVVGRYQSAGIFPEVTAWLYRQVADVWTLSNAFVAHWASYARQQDHRDLKVVLAAFLLVQSRRGDVVRDASGAVLFDDDDFREVGEAMMLLDFSPKLLLRVREVLCTPEVAAINRSLGFGQGARPFLGRWPGVVRTWLRHMEENPKLFERLLAAGFRRSVQSLARAVGYKPATPRFFAQLRWKQSQSSTGHRTLAIGETYSATTWAGLSEADICQEIMRLRPTWLGLVGRLPPEVGLTRAIVVAALGAGSLSSKDLIALTPTLEELGLVNEEPVASRWRAALRDAEDTRAMNIGKRVRAQATKDALSDAADVALKKSVEEAVRKLRIYFLVDVSGSMTPSIEQAKQYLTQCVQAFPLDQLHVAVFNTTGYPIVIKHASREGVMHAFRGITAGGGTSYDAGVRTVSVHKPAEDEDAFFIFVGDEEAMPFAQAFAFPPVAFGLVRVGNSTWRCVQETAQQLGIPCFLINEKVFADPYAIPRTLRAMIAATPVQRRVQTKSLVDTILSTPLAKPPLWARQAVTRGRNTAHVA